MSQQIATLNEQVTTLLTSIKNMYEDMQKIQRNISAVQTEFQHAETRVVEAESRALPPLYERTLIELNGEYKLRSFLELTGVLSASRDEICAALDEQGICFVTKRRIRDGAELIGLCDRN
jgi:hypothetical protein